MASGGRGRAVAGGTTGGDLRPHHQALELLEAFVALMPDAAVVVDDTGAIVATNEHTEKLFGYDPGDLVGREVEVLVPERFRHRHRGHRGTYAEAAHPRPMGAGLQLSGRRRDGTEFPVDISLAPVPGVDRPLFVAAVRDATERTAATAGLAQLAAIVRSSSDAIASVTVEGTITSWNAGAQRLFGYAASDIVGRHISLLIPEDASPEFEELLDDVLTRGGSGRHDTRWRRRDGSRVDVAVALSRLTDPAGRSLGFSAVVRDIPERKHAEAVLRQRERQQAAMAEVRLALLSSTPMADVLHLVCERASELLRAEAAAIVNIDEGERLLVVAAVGGAVNVLGYALSPTGSLAGRVAATGIGQVVATLAEIPGIDPAIVARVPAGPALGVPVSSEERVRAVLVLSRAEGAPRFEPEDVVVAQGLADQAALGLELGASREARDRLMLFDERERIARDLHDLVIQRLFAAGMKLQGVVRLTGDAQVAGRVNGVVDELDTTIREIRSTIFALESRTAGAQGLRGEILRLAEEFSESLGFPPAFRFDGPVDSGVPETVAPHLLAVVREALSNAARHARASRVDVDLRVGRDLVLVVQDDGVGLGARSRESGLANLRRRAEKLGGSLALGTPEGGGTRIEWRVPLDG